MRKPGSGGLGEPGLKRLGRVEDVYSCGSNPDGNGDAKGAQNCMCMMKTCYLAHLRQPCVCALQAEEVAPDENSRENGENAFL